MDTTTVADATGRTSRARVSGAEVRRCEMADTMISMCGDRYEIKSWRLMSGKLLDEHCDKRPYIELTLGTTDGNSTVSFFIRESADVREFCAQFDQMAQALEGANRERDEKRRAAIAHKMACHLHRNPKATRRIPCEVCGKTALVTTNPKITGPLYCSNHLGGGKSAPVASPLDSRADAASQEPR